MAVPALFTMALLNACMGNAPRSAQTPARSTGPVPPAGDDITADSGDADLPGDPTGGDDSPAPGTGSAGNGTPQVPDGPATPDDQDTDSPAGDSGTFRDPGSAPWQKVGSDQIRELCGLDPEELKKADRIIGKPWALVRHGRLCHSYQESNDRPGIVHSVTKTLGALTVGMVMQDAEEAGAAFAVGDPVRDHLSNHGLPSDDVRLAHVLAMVGHNSNLDWGRKSYSYDMVGTVQISKMSAILNGIMAEHRGIAADLDAYVSQRVFGRLGMQKSNWMRGNKNKNFATALNSTATDMVRAGLFILNQGHWQGERLAPGEYMYRMVHPAFEDANAGYGLLTWLNAEGWKDIGGFAKNPVRDIKCAPLALWSDAARAAWKDAEFEADPCDRGSCPQQEYDAGVWLARGTGGNFMIGHPGLNMVMAVKNSSPKRPNDFWQAVLPAVVNEDPVYKGDKNAFCKAYEAGSYAPDLQPWNPN